MSVPRTSICIPTRNGARWIESTLKSALSQHEDLEVIVSDDCSSDATVEIAQSTGDPRVHVVRAEGRLGMAGNWNRGIELSAAPYIKLLMQDDELLPGALAVQASLLDDHPSAGFAFGPRLLEGDGSPAAARWIGRYGDLHAPLAIAGPFVSGKSILATMTRRRLRANMIGEPSVVLIRRSTLARTGMFDVNLRQLPDLDLWIRLASVADAAFDPRPVARFRVHASSATARNRRTGVAWLDRLRIVDGLRSRPDTHSLVGLRHYAAAIGAGSVELGGALLRRERSLAAAWRDVRAYCRHHRRSSGA